MVIEADKYEEHYVSGSVMPYHSIFYTSAVDISDIARAAVKEEREEKRSIVRERLKRAKEEI
jgi:hypothetical protein